MVGARAAAPAIAPTAPMNFRRETALPLSMWIPLLSRWLLERYSATPVAIVNIRTTRRATTLQTCLVARGKASRYDGRHARGPDLRGRDASDDGSRAAPGNGAGRARRSHRGGG